MKNILLLALLISGSSLFNTVEAQSKKEVLVMEIHYITGYSGIYLHWQDKEMEFIDTEKPTTKTKIREQGKILNDVFQRLYNEGWEIENSLVSNASGFETIRYILVRNQ